MSRQDLTGYVAHPVTLDGRCQTGNGQHHARKTHREQQQPLAKKSWLLVVGTEVGVLLSLVTGTYVHTYTSREIP